MKKRVLTVIIAVLALTVTALAAFVWPGFLSASRKTAPLSGNDAAARSVPGGELRVYFIDVGQGDSTLITDGTHTVLVDAGDRDHGNKVYSLLHEVSGDAHIDMLIITHDHADHTGGLSKILKDCRADIILAPCFEGENLSALSGLLEAQRQHGAQVRVPENNETLWAGDIRLDLHRMGRDAGNENDGSIITRVQYGEAVFLLMADAGVEAETDWLMHSALPDLSCNVLRVGHHGSETSTSRRFLEAVIPEHAVISAGKDNTYGLPDAETVSRLAALGCNPWITAEVGTVVAVTDGESLSLRSVIPLESDVGTAPYIGNKKTLKLHQRDCSSVSAMSDKNKVGFDSPEEAFRQGYEPCGVCRPGQ